MPYDIVIGLEVHAQLLTRTKIFCGCSTTFGDAPNTNTCPVCMGLPGVLPVLNRRVVDCGIKLGLATGSTIETLNVFARKNYFYPDLPKGYQITQYEAPLCSHGSLEFLFGGAPRTVGITRIHMEEDAGKLIHDEHDPVSYVDFNRAGVPLLEIVSEPDIASPEEAVAYLKALRQLLTYLDICDGNMETGSLRCDANVSLKPRGSSVFGARTEVKNINSFKYVQRALEFEIARQRDILETGGAVAQETRLWDAHEGVTRPMRSKEESHDYRYFPEPDLLPLAIDEAWIEQVRGTLPELPLARRARFMDRYGLNGYDADILTQTRAMADYFEGCVRLYDAPKDICNWIMTEVLRVLKEGDLSRLRVTPEMLTDLIMSVHNGVITAASAKAVFEEMASTGTPPGEIIATRGLTQISDETSLRVIIQEALSAHP
ncbi:MAG TPA: Asp-tRNA(Asn)/Glu-tRNA(Gln) amidotransferase subunit GatB, partial [Deltaproteobacteria bacterium]|nr:Asp-tRNA(Asn)/Glu-tRNA(Gln) amidotransferase subunit GatB [Deltaproteobacteria bacterium]